MKTLMLVDTEATVVSQFITQHVSAATVGMTQTIGYAKIS